MVEQTVVQREIVDNQLVSFNFEQLNFKVYGTEEEPQFKCSDILIHILQYKKCQSANWFRNMDDELKNMYLGSIVGNSPTFNEQGLYWSLMKSDKPIARQFQKQVCDLLKNLRLAMKKRLEDKELQSQQQLALKDKEIQTLLLKSQGMIYSHKLVKTGDPLDGKTINIGQTVDYNRRMKEYETDMYMLESAYIGNEMIIHMVSYKIQGYQIESIPLLENITGDQLLIKEKELQLQYDTLNCPQRRQPLLTNRKKYKCDICNKQVFNIKLHQLQNNNCKQILVIHETEPKVDKFQLPDLDIGTLKPVIFKSIIITQKTIDYLTVNKRDHGLRETMLLESKFDIDFNDQIATIYTVMMLNQLGGDIFKQSTDKLKLINDALIPMQQLTLAEIIELLSLYKGCQAYKPYHTLFGSFKNITIAQMRHIVESVLQKHQSNNVLHQYGYTQSEVFNYCQQVSKAITFLEQTDLSKKEDLAMQLFKFKRDRHFMIYHMLGYSYNGDYKKVSVNGKQVRQLKAIDLKALPNNI